MGGSTGQKIEESYLGLGGEEDGVAAEGSISFWGECRYFQVD